jgi:hypothetical protein
VNHGIPAHVHFLIGEPLDFRKLETALCLSGDDHLESDTVFGVTDSPVVKVKDRDPSTPMQGLRSICFDFRLVESNNITMGRVGTSRITRYTKLEHAILSFITTGPPIPPASVQIGIAVK